MKFLSRSGLCAALLCLGYLGPETISIVPPAQAHGKEMNLTQYCKTKYEKGMWPIPWSAKYRKDQPESGFWECVQERRQGLNTVMGGSVVIIDPSKACLAQHRTSRIHFHEGGDPGLSSNMHCGLFNGTVPLPRPKNPAPEDRRHATIKVCNETAEPKLAVGYAYSDFQTSSLQSRGWWPVEKGECFDLNLPASGPRNQPYRGNAYLFGYHSKALLKGNGAEICINMGRKFTINGANLEKNCKASDNRTMINAMRFDLGGGTTKHIYKD